jgi:ubiquinone biosynthesis protein COQ4
VGELTGYRVLHNYLVPYLQQQVTGRELLRDRPVVSQATIPYERLLQQAREWQQQEQQQQAMTFGQAYGLFLLQHGFDPDERDAVQYLPVLEDSDEAYVMLRYRQCHDFFHALTGLPPTVPGELGLKWLELFQTRLPMTALACTAGSLTLSWSDCDLVWNTYLPWARICHHRMQQQQQQQQSNGGSCTLLNVYYEHEWDTPLDELRNRLGLIPAPVVE